MPKIKMDSNEGGDRLIPFLCRFSFLLLLPLTLIGADYDCIVVGTSPFSLFEALYQSHLGKSVLILEEADRCGGAWKGIDVCGVKNADLGCPGKLQEDF